MAISRKGWIGIFIAFAVVVIASLAYAFRDKLFGGKGKVKCDPNKPGYDLKGNLNPECNVPKPTNQETQWIPESFPLKKGMYGSKVKALQQALEIKADGQFWTKTEEAIKNEGYSIPLSEADYNAIVKKDIGENAYAKFNGVKIYKKDGSVYSTKNEDEWVGKIYGKKGVYTDKWIQAYIIDNPVLNSPIERFVNVDDVYVS